MEVNRQMSETEWFEDLIDTAGLSVRLAAMASREWIDRSQLGSDDSNDDFVGYVVDVADDGEDRYRMVTEADAVDVEAWRRLVFPIERKVGHEGTADVSDDELELVVDVSTDDGSLPESVPWQRLDEAMVSAAVFERDSRYSSINAGRVAGLKGEKDRLGQFLTESDEEWGLAEPTGVILEGPPGTGKTELVMEVCQERYGEIPVMISGPEILNKWVGESERLLREKFEEAWATEHKVLYIDELDAIAQSRSEVSENYSAQIVAQLLVLLDGVSSKEQAAEADRSLKVVASTNLSHVVDEALRRPGRLGNRPIQFSYPDAQERRAILHHYLENIYASTDGRLSGLLQDFVQGKEERAVDSLVEETEGFTGADLEDLVQAAVRQLRDLERDGLDIGTMREALEDEGFRQRDSSAEDVLPRAEIRDVSGEVAYDESKPGLYTVAEAEAEPMAKRYFANMVDGEAGEDVVYTLRRIEPGEVIASDVVRAKEQMVQAFQHRENERVALYFDNADLLVQAQEGSELADRLIGVMHEQFLQWNNQNVLLLPQRIEEKLIAFDAQ